MKEACRLSVEGDWSDGVGGLAVLVFILVLIQGVWAGAVDVEGDKEVAEVEAVDRVEAMDNDVDVDTSVGVDADADADAGVGVEEGADADG